SLLQFISPYSILVHLVTTNGRQVRIDVCLTQKRLTSSINGISIKPNHGSTVAAVIHCLIALQVHYRKNPYIFCSQLGWKLSRKVNPASRQQVLVKIRIHILKL